MADYISREAVISEFCDDCMDKEWCKSNGESCSRIKNINAVPASDVRPVVRGKWEPAGGSVFPMYACSLCRAISLGGNFCPNCGADLREPNLDTTKGDNHD